VSEAKSKPRAKKTAAATVPSAPMHLRSETAAWWSYVRSHWSLDEHHERLLTLAAESFDRASQAREALAEYGLTYERQALRRAEDSARGRRRAR